MGFLSKSIKTKLVKINSLFVLGLLILFYENCSKSFKVEEYRDLVSNDNLPAVVDSPPKVPVDYTNGVIMKDCLANNSDNNDNSEAPFNACIYNLSPVNQEGASVSPHVYLNVNNSKYQQFAVKIETDSGDPEPSLENKYFKMLLGGQSIKKNNSGNWKYSAVDMESNLKVLSVHQYAHLSKLVNRLDLSTGGKFEMPKISIEVNSVKPVSNCNAFYSRDSKAIEIGTCVDKLNSPNSPMSFGYDAEISIHEYGHAIIDSFSGGAMKNMGTEACGQSIYNSNYNRSFLKCTIGEDLLAYAWSPEGITKITSQAHIEVVNFFCASERGCSSAINEGQADFHVFLLFPDLKGLGATFLDSLKFQADVYGPYLRKNPGDLANLKMSELRTYDELKPIYGPIQYEIHLTGEIFSSILYKVYKNNNYSNEVIIFFQELQKTLTGVHNFSKTYCLIKNLDKALFNSKFISYFDQEYSNHGISKASCE